VLTLLLLVLLGLLALCMLPVLIQAAFEIAPLVIAVLIALWLFNGCS
jgi:hypothetical protein